MADYLIQNTTLTGIADEVRRIKNVNTQLSPANIESHLNEIERKGESDVTSVSGIVTIPAGYYPTQVQKQGDPTGDATMTSGDQMLYGVTAYSKGVKYTGTIPTKSDSGNVTLDASTTSKSYAAGYYPNAHGATHSTGDYSASASITTAPVVTPSISGKVTDISTTTKPSGTDGIDYWTIDPSGSVTKTGVATGTATISTTGYITSGSKTGTANITPTIENGTNRYITKGTTSKTDGVASASVTKDPTASVSITGNIGTTAKPSGTAGTDYWALTGSAASGVATASVTASSASVTAGYTTGVSTSTTTKSATTTEKTASATRYITKSTTSATNGTATATANAGIASITTDPSASASLTRTANIGTTTKPSGTAGTDY